MKKHLFYLAFYVFCFSAVAQKSSVSWRTMSSGEDTIHFLTYPTYITDFDRVKLRDFIRDFKTQGKYTFFFDGNTILKEDSNDTIDIKLAVALCLNKYPFTKESSAKAYVKSQHQKGAYLFDPQSVEIDDQFISGNVSSKQLIEKYEEIFGPIDISGIQFSKNKKYTNKIICPDTSIYSNNSNLHLCVNELMVEKIVTNTATKKVIVIEEDRWVYYYTTLVRKGFVFTKGRFLKYINAEILHQPNAAPTTKE